jgi:hypothetical protein
LAQVRSRFLKFRRSDLGPNHSLSGGKAQEKQLSYSLASGPQSSRLFQIVAFFQLPPHGTGLAERPNLRRSAIAAGTPGFPEKCNPVTRQGIADPSHWKGL